MKKRYGFPYKGSKQKIADDLISVMPSGKRFVDLFGGGGTMSHCAALSGKYDEVLYNEIDPVVCEFFKDCMSGKYNIDTFRPEWISRKRFHELKETDGCVRYIWSFSNNGEDYLYGKDIEEHKHALHQAIVFGDYSMIDLSDILDPVGGGRDRSEISLEEILSVYRGGAKKV